MAETDVKGRMVEAVRSAIQSSFQSVAWEHGVPQAACEKAVDAVLSLAALSGTREAGEPVRYQRRHPFDDCRWIDIDDSDIEHYRAMGQELRPLYAAPPTEVERGAVTDEAREAVLNFKLKLRLAFRKALATLPEIAPAEISSVLSSVHMQDAFFAEGKRLQREHGTDAVAPRVEQECGAGAWSFMRRGVLDALASPTPAPHPAVEAQGVERYMSVETRGGGWTMEADRLGNWVRFTDHQRALASEKARADRLEVERDANYNLATANGARAREEYERAEAAEAELAKLRESNERYRENLRSSFEAMCAMRDTINEHVPMPSLESDLLEGPEPSIFCAKVAEAVVAALRPTTSKEEGGVE